MSKQRINELGSDIRQLYLRALENETGHDDITPKFNAKLLDLINTALDSEEMVEKLFKLLEKSS